MTAFRSGTVAVVGRPNVGKSTLVNALAGRKVTIVSDKPQTTRHGIRAILTTRRSQMVLTDTPGFHKPRTSLGARLNGLVSDAVVGVDVVVHVVDAAAGVGRGDAFVYRRQVGPARGSARLCVVNKIDRLRHHEIVPQLAAAATLGDFDEIVPVSARKGEGVEEVRTLILERIPEGAPLYPEDVDSDQPLELQLAEIVREKALEVAREEVPHSIAVLVDELDRGDGLARVHATVVVERDSQKGIVIGRGGETLRAIGEPAREEMELLLGSRVYLDIRVKVLKNWQRDPKALNRLGL